METAFQKGESQGPRGRPQADIMEAIRSPQPQLDACNGTG